MYTCGLTVVIKRICYVMLDCDKNLITRVAGSLGVTKAVWRESRRRLPVNFGRSIEFTSKGAKSLGEETRVAAESADILRSVAWKERLMPVGIAISCTASRRPCERPRR